MEHIVGTSREQLTLLPEALEDYVSVENPVRFVDAFVNNLDLKSLGFQKVEVAETGRPPYQPADLLKLYIYGYLNRIRSSRRLERETTRNLEVLWLLKKLSPDHKTISNFRKDNRTALRLVCRQFVLLCQDLELFGAELIAIDGSRFAAVNSNQRNFNPERLRFRVRRIEETIDRYLDTLQTNDEQEASLPHKMDRKQLQEKIDVLKKRAADCQRLLSTMEENGDLQVSLTDPDSRMMGNHGHRDVSYNVQTAVDSKHKLIVEHEVTNEPNDRTLLAPIAKRTKETLGVERLEVCADKGYWSGTQLKECEDANIVPYISEHATTAKRKSNIPAPEYAHTRFHYDKESNTYLCPQGQELRLSSKHWFRGQWRYSYRTTACKNCPARSLCTADKQGRAVHRSELDEVLQRARERVRLHPEKIAVRKTLSEHPFGTLKHAWNHGYFLTRGLEKVQAEMSLTVLAYNIKRVINIVGVSALLLRFANTP
jgi:transposase